jgi:MFS transporter, DHA1 family, tetracycline resistance protein
MGLFVSTIGVSLYGLAPQGWMLYPLMVFGLFGWTIAQPALMGLMSRAISRDEQGLLQGAIASMNSLTAVVAPPVWTSVFAYFVSSAAPFTVPGAAFFGSSLVFAVAFALAMQAPSLKPAIAAA